MGRLATCLMVALWAGCAPSGEATCDATATPCCPWLSPTGEPTTACPAALLGNCRAGQQACSGDAVVCVGYRAPAPEICDGLDNDCDGKGDPSEDVENCGACGRKCENRAGAGVTCAAGQCVYGCNPSPFTNQFGEMSNRFVDRDNDLAAAQGQPSNGCECIKQIELCDGDDDDCDGQVDATLHCDVSGCSGAAGPPVASSMICNQLGVCTGSQPVCVSGAFRCNYMALGAELDGSGNLLTNETKCDGLDGDCDGQVDDAPAFSARGQACGVGNGPCRTDGTQACNAAGTALVCCATIGGSGKCTLAALADGSRSSAETCNNRDDDCDAVIDNPGQTCDSMVNVTRAAGGSFYMDRYEASRPDAALCSAIAAENPSDCSSGVVTNGRACSNNLRIPWANVTFDQASAACVAAGKRLCTTVELERACQGAGTPRVYPYSDTYNPTSCNGFDFDADSSVAGNQDDLIQTGFLAACASPFAVRDLSGNLREWTSTPVPEFRACTINSDCTGAVAGSSYTTGATCAGATQCQCAGNSSCIGPSTCVSGRCVLCQGGQCAFKMRSGGYEDPSAALACTFDSSFDFRNVAQPDYGFRCCRDTAPQGAAGPCP